MEKLLLNETDVLNQYNQLKNIHKVAEYFNVSISPIKRILKSNGIEITNRRYNVNHNYFDVIDTEEKAYWLGFLYADGYIRERKSGKSLEMKLSTKDKHHLERFRDSIESNHKIIDGFNNVKYKGGVSSSHMSSLAMFSLQLVESIKTQGVHSRKTFTIERPKINNNLIRHFIRGYFDGDGTFRFIESGVNRTGIVCASEKFRDFLIEELSNNDIEIKYYGGINLFIQNKIGNNKFYNYIYKNATIYLERKKEIYERFREYYEYNN
jgi:hypothetical protein